MLTRITFTPYIHPVISAARKTDICTQKSGIKDNNSAPRNPAKNTIPAHNNSFLISFLFKTDVISRQIIEKMGSVTPLKIDSELSSRKVSAR